MNGPPASEIIWSVGAMNVTLDYRGVTVTSGVTRLLGAQVDALVDAITTAQLLADSDKWWVPEGLPHEDREPVSTELWNECTC